MLLINFFLHPHRLTAVQTMQVVLWSVVCIWFVFLALPTIHLFENPAYSSMRQYGPESLWAVFTGLLLLIPILAHWKLPAYSRYVFIGTAIIRSGFFAFVASMFISANPVGLAGPIHILMAIFSLWVVWRVTDELYI